MSRSEAIEEPASPARSNGWGGRRPGSGRKRRGTFAPNQGDMDYARNLVSLMMRDEALPPGLRARCAVAILARGSSSPGRRPTLYVDPPHKSGVAPVAGDGAGGAGPGPDGTAAAAAAAEGQR